MSRLTPAGRAIVLLAAGPRGDPGRRARVFELVKVLGLSERAAAGEVGMAPQGVNPCCRRIEARLKWAVRECGLTMQDLIERGEG